MAPVGGWDEAIAANKEKGGFNHSASAVTHNGHIYCIGETKRRNISRRIPGIY